MSTDVIGGDQAAPTIAQTCDMYLEVVVIPVSNVDRAKAFYERLGWRLDADIVTDNFSLIQFTPPGSGCSIQFGLNLTPEAPGSAQSLYLIVSDLEVARNQVAALGVAVSDIFHEVRPGTRFDLEARRVGPSPDHRSYASFASFSDPEGNVWLFQEVTTRLPGHVRSDTTAFTSTSDLAGALRRAAAAHDVYEKRTGRADTNWPDWYADYLVGVQSGAELAS